MSAHRHLHDGLIAEYELIDPGDAGTIKVDRSPAVLNIVSAGAETRVIGAPTVPGQMLTICLKTDGGTVTITQAGSLDYDNSGNNSAPLDDAGDVLHLVSVDIGGTLYWRVISADGITLA